MANLRSEISFKSPYYISKHRYLELKHFCLQYPEWKDKLNKLNWIGGIGDGRSSEIHKPVERIVERRDKLLNHMEMVEQCCMASDGDIFEYLIKSVCYGVSYGHLRADGMPCSRDYFYNRYRLFFYLLDKVREK